jgi:hypothetical protein
MFPVMNAVNTLPRTKKLIANIRYELGLHAVMPCSVRCRRR